MTTKVTSSLINSVANTQITGTITDSQIASLATSKLTGTITNAQLAGSITADKITSIANTQITGAITAANINTGNWTIFESGGKLFFAYGGVNKFSMDSSGTIIAANNVTAAGTP